MGVLVHENFEFIVQGITGREALNFTRECLQYGSKIVGGVTPACAETAAAFYGRICEQVVRAASAREAEMAKLLENTYRHVNIALVNEMAIFCRELDIDLHDAITCAATQPFGFQPFYPGPGVGGHCIPIDPNYLSYKVRTLGYPFRFVELAQEIKRERERLTAITP